MRVSRQVDRTEFFSGVLVLGLAILIFLDSLNYSLGRLSNIGPSAFPVALAIILGLTGAALLVSAWGRFDPGPAVKWRALVFVSLSILFFAFAIGPLGLIPSTFGIVLISRFAEAGYRLVHVLALASGLSVLCWLLFVRGLNLPLSAFGGLS